MTAEEYLLKRIEELEQQNKELEQQVEDLIKSKEICFRFEKKDMPKHIYKVEFEDGNIKISREEYEKEVEL